MGLRRRPLDGATGSTLTVFARLAAAGRYTVTLTNAAGRVTSAPAVLTVQDVPLFLPGATALDQRLLKPAKETATFTVSAEGTGLKYQWFLDGKLVKGATLASYTARASTSTDGRYTLRLTDAANTTTDIGDAPGEPVTTLELQVKPKITTNLPSKLAGANLGGVTLTVAASGQLLTYQWTKNGVALPGQTAATLTLGNLSATDAGKYACVVRNAAGTVTSAASTLNVNAPPSITAQPAAQTVVAPGGNFTLSASAVGTKTLRYQWYLGPTEVKGGTKNVLRIKKAAVANAGTYTLRVTNGVGATTSAPAVVTVRP